MLTASLHLILHPVPIEREDAAQKGVDLYLSIGGPGLGIVVKDLRHGAFTLGITADGQMKSFRVTDMQDQGGVFSEAARFFMTTRKTPNNDLKHRLVSACASEGSRILSLRAAKQEEDFKKAKLRIELKTWPADPSSAGAHKENLQLA